MDTNRLITLNYQQILSSFSKKSSDLQKINEGGMKLLLNEDYAQSSISTECVHATLRYKAYLCNDLW